MIHVVAIITAKPGQRDAVLQAVRQNLPAVRAEEGCLEYTPVVDAEGMGSIATELGADTFAVIEKWASRDALMAHSKAPHMAQYAARVRDLIGVRAVHVLKSAV
ncbi:MAG TPA: putative quinol monooxygenase, partial [Burkholderiaceae bacterium]|nr:putative quinol monooxygenase [Burkholderiaceae bacterium]